jgi:hypothetical protein
VFVVLSQLRIASAIVQSTYIALLGSVALGAVRWRSDRGVGMSLNICSVRPTARARRSWTPATALGCDASRETRTKDSVR